MIKELEYTQLRRFCTEQDIDRILREQQDEDAWIIGQERAARALEFGLKIKTRGYNIYISGLSGTGKTTFAKAFAERIAKTEGPPDDLCYIYNFDDPKYPLLLKFKAGEGKVFKEDMDEFINLVLNEFHRAFSSDELEEQKNEVIKQYQDKKDDIIKKITDDAKAQEFGVKMTSSGIYFMPIVNEEAISEEQFEALADDIKEEISKKSEIIQQKALITMREIRDLEKLANKDIESIEYNLALFTLGRLINQLCEKYGDNDIVLQYLMRVKEDILANIGDFSGEENEEEESLQTIMPWITKKGKDDFLSKYKVNLIVDNSGKTNAPVITCYNPTYANIVGEVEYDSEFGNFITDFMKIKPGILHKANGGYLIMQMQDVLSNAHIWDIIKRVIKTNEIVIEPLREYTTGLTVSSIKPQPAKVNIKVILIGSHFYYNLLSEYDDEFQKYFKINAVFDYEMKYNDRNLKDIITFIHNYKGISFENGAVCRIIEYCMRLSENQNKITTRFGEICEILSESAVWANIDGRESVSGEYIKKAIQEKEFRNNIYEEKLNEMIDNGTIMLETSGQTVGQINGLAVLDTGRHIFAKPTKITATTYVGKLGVINVEKEAEMSGSIHDKGVQVLIGYLGQTYAQEFPLSLSCRVCFEQNYNGIDGDSASSTELYAVLSSIANVPIRQDIAVTGSINQMGQIQPIGGVTYKIEGFFEVCKARGLTGTQGVIIPYQNTMDLTLNDEVVEAVQNGQFHIYAISSINDGIEILTGIPAGEKNEKGKYSADSIHGMVYRRLKDFYKKSVEEF